MQFAEIPDQAEWNDEVPYASAFEGADVETPNPRDENDFQEEPQKKNRDRAFSNGKKKSLLDDADVVHARPVKRCCCHPLTIGCLTLLVLILICAGVIAGFIAADEIAKANAKRTPCTGKQTGDTCTVMDTGAEGICKLDDDKVFNDGELVCDDVTVYEEACEQKDSDDTCTVEGDAVPGRCMYTSAVSKVLQCNIPSKSERACLDVERNSKETGSECELTVGGTVEQGTCEVVIYSRMKECIIPDPDEEICASKHLAGTCTTSHGKKGTCEQMMDNQLKCVENAAAQVDVRIAIVVAVGGALILVGVIAFAIFCYRKQRN